MQMDRPFLVVTPTLDGDVLAAIAVADSGFTAPDVHRLLGHHSEAGVRKALRRLTTQGIVYSERVGGADVYRFNQNHLAAGPVRELAQLFTTFLDRLGAAIDGWVVQPELVTLFGSAAKRQMQSDSDIDVFIIGTDGVSDDPIWREQIGKLEHAATSWTGNDTRVLEYSVSDVHRGPDPVLDQIRAESIHISGDRNLLRSASQPAC